MKTKSLTLLLFFISLNFAFSQDIKENYPRFIEVTGSAEKEIKPDIILYDICIQEYFKEEYEAGKDYKDYVTKISLDDIEKELVLELSKLGISKDQITITEGNNYSKINGKSFMSTKTLQLNLSDFKKINELIQKIKTKGISYMRIAELKNKDLSQFKKQVKIDAMKDAKEKAALLLESVGNTIGQVISVKEIDNNPSMYMTPEELHNMATIASSSNSQNNTTNENVVLKYIVKVRFEIK